MSGDTPENESRVTLILLVGSNPLPNYLAACALRPGRIALMYTSETESAKDRLRRALAEALGDGIAIDEAFVQDATCATTVCRVVSSLMDKDDGRHMRLNYTGGTKVMAAHARMAFAKRGGQPQHASYLDEGGLDRQARLCFDDGNPKPLSDCLESPLELGTVLALHGITHKPRKARTPAPTTDDAREILCKVLAEPPLAADLYGERERLQKIGNPNKATSEPFRADRYGLSLSVPEFPKNEQMSQFANGKEKRSWFEQWSRFIGGEWLEEWLRAQIHALELAPPPEITVGVNASRGEKVTQLEVDVAVIRGHRSYFVSCTTDATKHMCKLKLFEVAVRSRQLGGDLARAAVVCLADDQTVSALQNDVNDVWGASNATRVFGRPDVQAWSDCDGKRPNRQSLKEWLES